MYIEPLLFVSWFISLLFLGLLYFIFKLNKSTLNILCLLTTFFFFWAYLFGSDLYNKHLHIKAFNSEHQIQQCGWFEYKIRFNQTKRKYEIAYQLRNSNLQFIQVNGDEITQEQFPILNQLQPKQKICYQYAKNIKDFNGRYILTQLAPN